jgi:archaellum component FlaC
MSIQPPVEGAANVNDPTVTSSSDLSPAAFLNTIHDLRTDMKARDNALSDRITDVINQFEQALIKRDEEIGGIKGTVLDLPCRVEKLEARVTGIEEIVEQFVEVVKKSFGLMTEYEYDELHACDDVRE